MDSRASGLKSRYSDECSGSQLSTNVSASSSESLVSTCTNEARRDWYHPSATGMSTHSFCSSSSIDTDGSSADGLVRTVFLRVDAGAKNECRRNLLPS